MPKFEIVTIDEAKKAVAEGERRRRQRCDVVIKGIR